MCFTLDGNRSNYGQIIWNLDLDTDSEMERWNWKMIQAPRKGTNLSLNSSEPFLDGKMMRNSKKLILVSFAQLTLLREVVLNLFWGQRLF